MKHTRLILKTLQAKEVYANLRNAPPTILDTLPQVYLFSSRHFYKSQNLAIKGRSN